MKHFLVFMTLIMGFLVIAFTLKSKNTELISLKVFATSSFISQWGPGPLLKENFEKTCQCQVNFFDSASASYLLQRMKTEKIDLVMGFDQFDLELANQQTRWMKPVIENINWQQQIEASALVLDFVAYDWGILSFLVRKSETDLAEIDIQDLLRPEWKEKVSLQDPRTSSVGLQFLFWATEILGKEKTFDFFKKLNQQVLMFAPSWSTSYGLFQKKQVATTFSYVTSSIYHQVEENNFDIQPLKIKNGHPIQVEYMGIPENCLQCDLAAKFMNYLLTDEAQKIIMTKNYMFPVLKGIEKETPFEPLIHFPVAGLKKIPDLSERELILKKWSDLRQK